jgi:TatD DNase family protein
MGANMFDIGLNLTSSQFAKDRDEVVARAFTAERKANKKYRQIRCV